MFAPQWSVFAEYNFMGFGTQSATFTGCGGSQLGHSGHPLWHWQ